MARVSGKVDAVRLPKELYYATRVMGNPNPRYSYYRPLELSGRNREEYVRNLQYGVGATAFEWQIARY